MIGYMIYMGIISAAIVVSGIVFLVKKGGNV